MPYMRRNNDKFGGVRYNRIAPVDAGLYEQQVYVCPQCGFVRSGNPLREDEVNYLYAKGDDYTNYSDCSTEKPNYVERVRRCIDLLHLLKMEYHSVLDIGASTGYFLSLFPDKDRMGVETSLPGVSTAKNRYHLDIFCGTFQEYFRNNPNEKFDLVVMSHVMEHIDNLNQWMECILSVASKYLYVEVPMFRTNAVEPFGVFAEEHLNYFVPESLLTLIQTYGYGCIHLDIDYMIPYRIANGFPMIRAVFQKGASVYRVHSAIKWQDDVREYLEWSHGTMMRLHEMVDKKLIQKKFAIWGASFQTERLLATQFRYGELRYIIDNSPEKQNCYVWYKSKKISVVAPSLEKLAGVDYIVISTWNNQAAIYRQICGMGAGEKAILLYE